ncbi:hypothetical protein CEXT_778171 [Caerostris extrusa]|uniref:Uncharacterized protein n=1 Tax=Caerostris extrusa TaxID=172846 RepID=A0AAV4RBY6_CAEEX|nr:hypothetical protein CEXT_778171 [Caerostris extrusa]
MVDWRGKEGRRTAASSHGRKALGTPRFCDIESKANLDCCTLFCFDGFECYEHLIFKIIMFVGTNTEGPDVPEVRSKVPEHWNGNNLVACPMSKLFRIPRRRFPQDSEGHLC